MDKDTLNKLLDSIYELEGLVHLALNRDDNPEHLPELIKRKGAELAQYAAGLKKSDIINKDDDLPEVNLKAEKDYPLYSVDMATTDGLLIDSEDVDDMAVPPLKTSEETSVAATPLIEEDMVSVIETVFNDLQNPDIIDIEEKAGDNGSSDNSKEPRGKLVFSINDRYLFKRELFGNSDVDFNNTLSLVASMEDYDEAEDYFLGELQWDQKKSEVNDFLEIIKRYFKE